MNLLDTIFVEPWPFWVAGGAIGLFVPLFAWLTGKALGVSTAYGAVCSRASRLEYFRAEPYRVSWRIWFIVGIPLGALVGALLAGGPEPTFSMGRFDAELAGSPWTKALPLLAGGALVGFGARWAGGCPSGHSITGIAQGAKSSIVATMGFMLAGLVVTNLIWRAIEPMTRGG